MSVVVRAPATGGGGGGGGAEVPARNVRGSVSGLAPQATTTLCTVPATGYKLRGFVAFGDNDFLAWVDVDGVALDGVIARAGIIKVAEIILPNPEATVGTTVSLKVKNDAPTIGGVSAHIEGTLLGE